MSSETAYTLLRQLKFAINSESHTPEEWQKLLGIINEIGQKAQIRLGMFSTKDLEIVADEVTDDKKLDTDEDVI